MKKKIILSPLLIIILIIVFGVGVASAAVYFWGGGKTEEVNLLSGLIGQWKFDGNTKDSTANANNGTLNGNAAATGADRKGQVNKALTLDGNGDYVTIPDKPAWNFMNSDFTFSVWVKFNAGSLGAVTGIWEQTNGGTEDYFFSKRDTDKLSMLAYNSAYKANYNTDTTVTSGVWYYITFQRSGNTGYIYINGVSQPLTTTVAFSAAIADISPNIEIGGSHTDSDRWWLNGFIDDLRIYNRALSQAEITTLYESYDPGIVISDLQKGLVGNWKFNGTAKDSTANSNHGTVTGAIFTTDRKGQANKAYSFNGTTDYINAGSGSSLNFGTSDFSIELWFKTNQNSASTYVGIATKRWSGLCTIPGGYEGYGVYFLNNELKIFTCDGVDDIISTAVGTYNDNEWHHVAAIFDRDGKQYLYVDGALKDSDSITAVGNIDNGQPFNIGKLGIGLPYSGYSSFNGLIDDVRVYNRVLSATEITALYESYDPGIVISDLQKGLMGNWKFNGNAKDSTANSNHGTVTGAILTTDRKGQVNKAYSFDGVDDYVDAGNPASLNPTAEITVELWVKFNAWTADWSMPISKGGGGTPGYRLGVHPTTKKVYFETYTTAGTNIYANTFGLLSLNTWYHLAGTYKSGELAIYVNLVKDSAVSTGALNTGTGIVYIGSAGGTDNRVNGLIDEVRIYNRALSATEITALYESY